MLYINEGNVLKLLNWNEIFEVIEVAMRGVTKGRVIQNPRSATGIPGTRNILFTMPGYIDDGAKMRSLACKLVTSFPGNATKRLPSILGNILLFDEDNGKLQAVIDGTEITSWRTAAASAVATRYLTENKPRRNVLAIVGSGVQAKIHALAFQHFFKFNKVHIWGRTPERAEKLTRFLQDQNIGEIRQFLDLKACVEEADVIVTTTFAKEPLVKNEWLKNGYHICAVGAGDDPMEIDLDTYRSSDVFVDHLSGAKEELKHLVQKGVVFKNEVGALIEGTEKLPSSERNTVFQSLGMAVEDCVVAKLIYCKYIKSVDKL